MEEQYNNRLLKVENQLKNYFPKQINYEWVQNISGMKAPLGKMEEYTAFCKPAKELLNRGGKRWRPVLMLLTCEITGGEEKDALPLSPLVEFPHNGSLIIDDIEDKSDWRRGGKAVHLIYGDDFAINAGNMLYYMPTTLIDNSDFSQDKKLMLYQSYSENMRRLHFGQGFDILWHNSSIIPDPQEYEQMCKFKTGSLARMAAQTGVIAGGGSKKEKELLGTVCESMGVGFQIMDDVLNLTTGNPGKGRGDDIVEGKKSLPVIYYLKKNSNGLCRLNKLFELAGEKGLKDSEKEINEAVSILDNSGAIKEAKERALMLMESSEKIIKEHFAKSEATDLIIYMMKNFIK